MATSTGTRNKRAQPSTHPTVYVGLLLAIGGLLVAMYAYTGTRIYDATYFFVAIGGGLLALFGMLTAAWGRAVATARAQRVRRQRAKRAAESGAAIEPAATREAAPVEQPPTVAAPREKRRIAIPSFVRRGKREGSDAEDEAGNMFSFRRRAARNEPEQVVVEETPASAAESATTHATDVTSDGVEVRITLKCPQCATQFTAEGVQPIAIECPSCGLTGQV